LAADVANAFQKRILEGKSILRDDELPGDVAVSGPDYAGRDSEALGCNPMKRVRRKWQEEKIYVAMHEAAIHVQRS
jgi:hypothetical protein